MLRDHVFLVAGAAVPFMNWTDMVFNTYSRDRLNSLQFQILGKKSLTKVGKKNIYDHGLYLTYPLEHGTFCVVSRSVDFMSGQPVHTHTVQCQF